TSNQPGTNVCSITAQVSAFCSQEQANEVTAFYINDEFIGITSDNHCNGPPNENCVFCDIDTQQLDQKTIVLQEENVLKIHGYDSHAIVSLTLDCEKQYDSCENNLPPTIKTINNKTIRYDSSFTIDLWDFARDSDHRLSELTFSFLIDNNNLSCSLNNNRYLECSSSLLLGETVVWVGATDPCGDVGIQNFVVNIQNNSPTISIPNQEKCCSANLTKFINLKNYSMDEEKSLLTFNITGQSNSELINCFIEDNIYLSCSINYCDNNYSDITVQVQDIFSETNDTTFRISIMDCPPYLKKPFPDICLNENTNDVINLKEYFYDKEDGNNLTFSLTQTNTNNISCRLDNNYISCDVKTNAKTFNDLEITVNDSGNNSITEKMMIETNCFNNTDIDFYSDQKFFCLEDCTSHTQEITLVNNSDYVCFNFELEHDEYLNASLSNNSFCMNKNESRKLYFSVNTCNADNSFYDVKIVDNENDIELIFEYQIGGCSYFGEIEVKEFDGFVCSGDKKEFLVTIRNDSNEQKTLFLNAENQLLLPYFSKEKIFVPAFESRDVRLTINAKGAIGKHIVQLSAISGNYHIEKMLVVDVKDCSDIRERNFLIEVPNVCFDVSKGQTFESSFNVRRVSNDCIDCSFNEKSIQLAMYGLQNQLSKNIVSLSGTTSEKIFYSLKIPENASAGIRFVTVSGEELPVGPFAEVGFVQDEQICLNVLGTSASSINIRTESRDIIWCDSEIFEIEIINNGDFEETFSLSALQLPVGVNVNFSQQQVTVSKKSSKIIYVSVSTNTEAVVADGQSILIKLDGNVPLEAKIYFNIIGKPFFDNIEIMSYTSIIEMNSNSEKNYYIQIRNNSDLELKNLKISFENVPQGIEIEEKMISLIGPKEVLTLSGKVISKDINGNFSPLFVIEKVVDGLPNQLLNKKEFYIIVFSDQAFFGGLFGFNLFDYGNNSSGIFFMFIGVVGLLTLLLIIVILSVVFSASYSEKKEVWVGVEE
ncbi:MAG: hypothetical protein PHP82_03850, partial [Candidatus ainarchaeum sp.]|nr:hypothetical protein [Candidatus ainarchaeum sp.]